MSFRVKLSLAKQLSQSLKTSVGPNTVDKMVKNMKLSSSKTGEEFHYYLPRKLVDGNITDSKIRTEEDNIAVPLDRSDFIKQVLSSNDDFFGHRKQLNTLRRVIVEFSSPNIAKPFHMGHFRTTVLGNFVANLSNYFVNDVIKLNYLGDWGTQFGLLQIGLKEMSASKENLESNPLEVLYKAYVKANEMAKENPDLQRQASDIFQRLEHQTDDSYQQDWLDFRKATLEELRTTYERLGVHFTEYNWESDYAAQKIMPVLGELRNLNQVESDGGHVFLPLDKRKVTLVKTNGCTMYLTRDIAAAMDRYKKYNFDKMIYVTDLSQGHHFQDLIHILDLLGQPWSKNIQHIKFGKISGMSSRAGTGVFLRDLLDEARDKMVEKQKTSPTTRVEDQSVCDVLGISALVVYHLKMRRLKGGTFSWDECLQLSGDGGVKLQYTHCRLMSLEEKCGLDLPTCCDPAVLQEPIAVQLVLLVAQFDDVLCAAHVEYESAVLVKYLFTLVNTTNKALKLLQVKGEDPHVAAQRLLLFHKARIVLREGMCILGLNPLSKM